MAILDLSKIGADENTASDSKKKKTPSQFWLNVGIVRGTKEAEKFLQLPVGIALDELQAKDIPSSRTENQEFRNQRIAEKQLWELVKTEFSKLKPGEELEVPLVCRIRRINEKEQLSEKDVVENPFAIGALEMKKTA